MKKPDISIFGFTATEIKIARELSKGGDRGTIAHNLAMNRNTLDVHTKNIRRKMHVTSSFRCGVILAKYF